MTLMNLLWAIAFGICPQRPSHSLFFASQQMPIEARMAGIFGGFVLTTLVIFGQGRGRAWNTPGRTATLVLLGFIALLGVDGANAFLYDVGLPNLYAPNLALRLATGLLTGLAAAAFVVPAFNSTVWQTGQDAAPLDRPTHWLAALVPVGGYLIAGLSGWPPVLYPLSILAVIGVPALLGTIGTIVFTSLTRRVNRATNWREALPVMLGGLLLALLMLATFSAVRYGLFGPGPLDMPMR